MPLYLALVLTFAITPIKAGSLEWVALLWVALCSLTLAIIIIRTKLRHLPTNTFKASVGRVRALFILCLFQAWSLLQAVALSPDQTASFNSAILGIGFIILSVIWVYSLHYKTALLWLYRSIICFTLIQSVYGLWTLISHTDLLLWMPKQYYLDRPTGFFVNANHFAAYLVITIILILSHSLAMNAKKSNAHEYNEKKINFLMRGIDATYNPKLFILGILIATLVMSKSIGAIASLMVVLALMSMNFLRQSSHKTKFLLVAALFAGIILLSLLSINYALIEDEVAGLRHTVLRRYELSAAALSMLQDHWLIGVGGGSFYAQFSPYRSLQVGNAFYNHAHNDLIQFWIEYGIIGITLLTLFLIVTVRDNMSVLNSTESAMKKTFAYAALYSVAAVLVHSLVDFPLHIPGFSVLFLTIISINSLHAISASLFTYVDNQKT